MKLLEVCMTVTIQRKVLCTSMAYQLINALKLCFHDNRVLRLQMDVIKMQVGSKRPCVSWEIFNKFE